MTPQETDKPQSSINVFTARFDDPELEARYNSSRRERDLRQFRLAAVLSAIAYLIFAVLDWLVISENVQLALALRILAGVPGSALIFGMTKTGYFKERPHVIGWLGISTATLIYAAINIFCDTPSVYHSGYIFMLVFLFFLFPLNFGTSVAIGVVCTVAFAMIISIFREIGLGELLTIYSQYVVMLLAGGFSVHLVNMLRRNEFLSEMKIEKQKTRYHELLNRILPNRIVGRMERGEEQIADDVPAAVVLFADVVSFTDKAARHPPDVIVRFLNELFEKFDVLVRKHGLEKIKTIGDAYMVAGGLAEPKVGHIAAAADFALDLIATSASHFDPDDKAVKIRIGIHSGPVLAGVIGKTRFGYDLWGDTVNLASRLQGSAPPNSILVSKEVQADLADRFSFQHLGTVELKGKGEVSTWLLNGRIDSESGEN